MGIKHFCDNCKIEFDAWKNKPYIEQLEDGDTDFKNFIYVVTVTMKHNSDNAQEESVSKIELCDKCYHGLYTQGEF